jgi:hypothetical protein
MDPALSVSMASCKNKNRIIAESITANCDLTGKIYLRYNAALARFDSLRFTDKTRQMTMINGFKN